MSNLHATNTRAEVPRAARVRRHAFTTRLLAVSVIAHTVASVADAHPFGNRFTAQRLEVDVRTDGLVITITADVPDPLLRYMAPSDADPSATVLARLDHGIAVTIDHVAVPLRALDKHARVDLVQGTDHVLQARWAVDADLRGRHAIRIANGNLGDQPSYFRDEVRLPPTSRLFATNLVVDHLGTRRPLHDVWSPAEQLRRVDLDLEVPDDALSRAFRRLDDTPWTIELAQLPAARAWSAGRTGPLTLLIAVATAAIAGLGSGLAAGGRARAITLGAAGALVAVGLGGVGAGPLGVGVAIGALIGALGADLAIVTPLLTAPWAAAAVAGPTSGLVVAAWLLGAAASVPFRGARGAGLVLVAIAGVVAAARG